MSNMSLAESPAFIHFKSTFKGDLILPSDTEYKASLARWSVLAERQAGIVAFVRDEQDVSAAIKFAVNQKIEIAIKGESDRPFPSSRQIRLILGGGHNPSGASSTNGGIVIDLSRYCNKVTVDEGARIAHVQGGALWQDVDDATCPLGLATVGGTMSEVSIVPPPPPHLC